MEPEQKSAANALPLVRRTTRIIPHPHDFEKALCQTGNIRGVRQLALRKLAGATRTATGLLKISISTITRRSPSAIW